MFSPNLSEIRSVLCLGAHADDIEIGCGGTLLQLLETRPDIEVHWVVLSADDVRASEARRSAEQFLEKAGKANVVMGEFRDSFFPYQGEPIKRFIHCLRDQCNPDIVFTHRLKDMHQDHRFVAEITWNAFRDHLIAEYEIPKYEGDLGRPNVYIPLDEAVCRRKIEILTSSFSSQLVKPWFTDDTFWGLMRLRGIECGSGGRFAEAFHCRKLTLSF